MQINNNIIKILMVVNILIYVLVGYLSGSMTGIINSELDKWASVPFINLLLDPNYQFEFWRLISCQFMHADIQHIAFNMWCLYSIGTSLMQFVSEKKFIIIYLVSGLGGAILSSITMHFSVGASGAVFGLAGYLATLLYFLKKDRPYLNINILGSIGFFIIINLFFGFVSDRIDNAGHIGGLLTGSILYLITRYTSNNKYS